jgi:protein TonB
LTGAKVVVDLAEKAQEGNVALEAATTDAIKIARREPAEVMAATAMPEAMIERAQAEPPPAEIELDRKPERTEPKSDPAERPESPENLPVVRSIAAAPTVGEVDVELPAVQVANGRGQDGLGTGNTQGAGNGGASGKAGGDFDSLARGGPLNLSPTYPPEALAARIEGIVYVQFVVAADGSAKSATIHKSSGYEILDEAVLKVAKLWRFEAARRGGVPVECTIRVPFVFSLSRR